MFYGRSGTGKTYTAVQILSLMRRMNPKPYVILVSPNAETDPTWKQATKEWGKTGRKKIVDRHFSAYTPEVKSFIKRVIDRQKRKPVILMVDDLGEDHTIKMTYIDNPLRKIAISSRHIKITLMMLYQDVSETLRIIATNADVIVAKQMGGVQREKFRKLYLEDFTKEEFEEACAKCWTEKWDSLVVDRTNPQNIRIWRNFEMEIKIRQDVSAICSHFFWLGIGLIHCGRVVRNFGMKLLLLCVVITWPKWS